jgi:hypothetical protein
MLPALGSHGLFVVLFCLRPQSFYLSFPHS